MSSKKYNRINDKKQPKFLCWSLFFVFIFGVFTYGYYVRGAIVNIVARESTEKEFLFLTDKVATLESEYLRAKNNVTKEKAEASGFTLLSAPRFVTNDTSNSGLTLIGN